MRKSLCADRTIHDRHNSAIHYERCYSQSESPYGRHYGFLCLLNSITGMPITLTPEARRNTTEWLIAINAKLILAPSHAANIRDAALHLSLHKLAQSVESFFIFLFFPPPATFTQRRLASTLCRRVLFSRRFPAAWRPELSVSPAMELCMTASLRAWHNVLHYVILNTPPGNLSRFTSSL